MSDLQRLLARVAQLDEGLAQELGRHLQRRATRAQSVADVLAIVAEIDGAPTIALGCFYDLWQALRQIEDVATAVQVFAPVLRSLITVMASLGAGLEAQGIETREDFDRFIAEHLGAHGRGAA